MTCFWDTPVQVHHQCLIPWLRRRLLECLRASREEGYVVATLNDIFFSLSTLYRFKVDRRRM